VRGTSANQRAGDISHPEEKVRAMPQVDFKPPRSLKDAFQRFSLELNCMMVWLRDEARFHDNYDHAVLDAASLLCSTLEDAHAEAVRLTEDLEKRVVGDV